jgi:hypothetical protein
MKSRSPSSAHCRSSLDAQQGAQCGLEPAPLRSVGDVLDERRLKLLAGRRVRLPFCEARTTAHHLAECPERDALAIRWRSAAVPVIELWPGEAVEVLLQLPDEPALADTRLTGDRDHAQLLFALGGVELILEQSQLLVTTHEGWLEALIASLTANPSDDAQCAPRRHDCFLSLQDVLAGGLIDDRCGGGALGRLAYEHHPTRRRRLQARRRVDHIASDHALVPDRPPGPRALPKRP